MNKLEQSEYSALKDEPNLWHKMYAQYDDEIMEALLHKFMKSNYAKIAHIDAYADGLVFLKKLLNGEVDNSFAKTPAFKYVQAIRKDTYLPKTTDLSPEDWLKEYHAGDEILQNAANTVRDSSIAQ